MMTDKPPYRPRTILDDAEPLSEEEHQQLARTERERWLGEDAEKWAEDRLNEIYNLAIFNKNISRALCERAAHCANGNTELTDLIKEKLTRAEKGRPKNTPPGWLLLLHYANAMIEFKYDRTKAIEQIIDYEFRMRRVRLNARTIDNRISKIVTDYYNGKIEIPFDGNKLPGWAEDVIHERIAHGDKTKKIRTKK